MVRADARDDSGSRAGVTDTADPDRGSEHQLAQEVTIMSTDEIKRRIEAMFADDHPHDTAQPQGRDDDGIRR